MRAQKSIILLGGSNAVIKEGLADGLAQLGDKVHNLALGGGTNNIQALQELLCPRNAQILQNADLIVLEKSLNDIGAFANELECASLEVLKRNARWCFETLHKINKKVCILLLPRYDSPSL